MAYEKAAPALMDSDGIYNLRLANYQEKETQYGERVRWGFVVIDGDYEGQWVNFWTGKDNNDDYFVKLREKLMLPEDARYIAFKGAEVQALVKSKKNGEWINNDLDRIIKVTKTPGQVALESEGAEEVEEGEEAPF